MHFIASYHSHLVMINNLFKTLLVQHPQTEVTSTRFKLLHTVLLLIAVIYAVESMNT